MSEMREVKLYNADPAAIGVFGLAMITLVASSQKLGLTSGSALLIPWAIFLGAGLQLYACYEEVKRGNIFGAYAFGGFAGFWLAVAMSWMILGGVFGPTLQAAADPKQLGFAFLGFIPFCLFLTVGTLYINKCFVYILVFVDLLVIGLTMNSFGIAPEFSHALAAWAELFTAIVGFYTSGALYLNQFMGRQVLTLGKPFLTK